MKKSVNDLLGLAETNPVAKTAAILEGLSATSSSPYAQPNTEAFFIRLSKLKLVDDHGSLLTLNNDKKGTILKLIYLMTGLLVTGDLERDDLSFFVIASGSQRKIPREEMISQCQSAGKRLRRDCAPDRVGNGFVLSNIATLLPKSSMTDDMDIPLEKAESIAAQTVTLVDSVKGKEREDIESSLKQLTV